MIKIPFTGITLGSRKKIIAVFVDETNATFRAKKKYQNNTFDIKINGEKHTYIIDPKKIYIDQKTKDSTSFYKTNSPEPISLEDQAKDGQYDAVSFKRILENKVVADLFNMDMAKNMKLLMILIGINLLLTIVMLLHDAGLIKFGGGGS